MHVPFIYKLIINNACFVFVKIMKMAFREGKRQTVIHNFQLKVCLEPNLCYVFLSFWIWYTLSSPSPSIVIGSKAYKKTHKSFRNYLYLIDSLLTYFKISSMFSCRRLQSWIKAYLRRNPFGIWSCLTLGHKLRGRGYSCGNESKIFFAQIVLAEW